MKDKASQKGFTLIELLIVISIIGLLASIILYATSIARAKGRDAKRVADVKQLTTALETYKAVNQQYPISPGSTGAYPETTNIPGMVPTFMAVLPTSPLPAAGGECIDSRNEYRYRSINGQSYSLTFCIGTQVGSLAPGYYIATGERTTKRYDINADGAVNIADANYLATSNQINKCIPPQYSTMLEVCDVTLNGEISGYDSACIAAIILNPTTVPAACIE